MKSLKRVFLVVLFSMGTFSFTYAQSKIKSEVKIEELGFTVSSINDLKTIDWDKLFAIFDSEMEDSKISLYVKLEDVDVITLDNTEMSFSNVRYAVSGYVYEKEKLKGQMKGITNRLVTKYQDN